MAERDTAAAERASASRPHGRERARLLVLLPATSYRVDAFVRAADRLDVELWIGTDLPGSFARLAREGGPSGPRREIVSVDFARADESAEALAAHGFDGVVGTNEASAVVAALVARRLGLPHMSAEGAYAARDKVRMRELLAAEGVPSPRFRVALPGETAEDVAREVRFPCVVKPPMLTGSQGVIRADDHAELARALARVRAILARHPSEATADPAFHRVIVEDYLPGKEVAVEAIVTHGELEALAIFDKPDDLTGPYFEETLYVTPSRLAPSAQAAILDATARAARALGLSHGPIHAELRADGDRAAIVELAARSIGGLCSRVFELTAGPLEDLLVSHAVGLPWSSPRARREGTHAHSPVAAGVMMMPIPRSGVLRSVSGVEEARAVAGVVDVHVAIRPGDAIRALPEGASYLGFVFARGATPDAVERSLRDAWAALRFELAPLLDTLP